MGGGKGRVGVEGPFRGAAREGVAEGAPATGQPAQAGSSRSTEAAEAVGRGAQAAAKEAKARSRRGAAAGSAAPGLGNIRLGT